MEQDDSSKDGQQDLLKTHFGNGIVMIELQGNLKVSDGSKLNNFDLGDLTLRQVSVIGPDARIDLCRTP